MGSVDTAAKPEVVLVTGAWHTPEHYEDLFAELKKLGYNSHSIKLPSIGSDDPKSTTYQAEVDAVREKLIFPLLDAGKNVVVVGHSYGACVGGSAIYGLVKGESERPGSVIGFAVISGFPHRAGASLRERQNNQTAAWVNGEDLESKGVITVFEPIETFFHDVPAEKAKQAVAALEPQAFACFTQTIEYEGWSGEAMNGRRLYVYCTEDKALPMFVQKALKYGTGVEFIEREIASSHSPFLSMPAELASTLDGVFKDW